MKPQDIERRLEAISVSDSAKIEALAAEILASSRESPRAAAQLWVASRGSGMADKTAQLLSALEDAAIYPLMDLVSERSPQETSWLLRTFVAEATQLRVRMFARLDKAMHDVRPIPEPPNPIRAEGTLPPRRICDEAYLLGRQFLGIAETRTQYYLNEKAYLNLPEARKDEEIKKFLKLRVWTQFVEDPG